MDLLGSILNAMDKPPEVDEKRKQQMKSVYFINSSYLLESIIRRFFFSEQKQQLEKQQAYEKHEMAKFRRYCEERVNRFMKDENRKSLQFQPLNRFYRSIV